MGHRIFLAPSSCRRIRKKKLLPLSNTGFTLIEAVISIVILLLLMIPAFSGYISAAYVNSGALASQKAGTLGQSIMEALKNRSVEEIAKEFNAAGDFTLVDNSLTGNPGYYQMKAHSLNGYGEYVSDLSGLHRTVPGNASCSIDLNGDFAPPAGRDIFQFGILDIRDGDASYDVVVTLDAKNYRIKYPGTLNNFQMPKLIDLYGKNVSIIDPEGFTASWSDATESAVMDNSDSTNTQALEYFKNIWLSYQAYIESLPEEITPTLSPAPVYTENEIKSAISKELSVIIQKNSYNTILLSCSANYSCALDLNCDGCTEKVYFPLFSENAVIPDNADTDKNIYLFYTPSDYLYKDTITVENDDACVNLMVARQEGSAASAVTISKTDINGAQTKIYTNIPASEIDSGSLSNITGFTLVTKNNAKDCIYNIRVAVYTAGSVTAGNLSEPVIVLNSTGVK